MTVKELIKKLSRYNDDDIIVLDLQGDKLFNDDLYDFQVDRIEITDSINEIRFYPIN